MHGGLSPELRTLDQIRVIARAQEIPHEGAFCGQALLSESHAAVYLTDSRPGLADLMWSDPDDIDTWSVSPRGAGWLFGSRVTDEVMLPRFDLLILGCTS